MGMIMTRSMAVQDLWNVLLSQQTTPASIGELIKKINILGFSDEFNRTAVDADVWTEGGDGGIGVPAYLAGSATGWMIQAPAVINNDRYIHGGANIRNRRFSPAEDGYTTITYLSRLGLNPITDVSAFWGLVLNAFVDYLEPVTDCAHFFADPVVGANFYARSYNGAEEQTDTGIALDAVAHDFGIIWTAASVLFYIDGALVATHAVQVPDTPMCLEFLIRSEAAGLHNMNLERVYVEVS